MGVGWTRLEGMMVTSTLEVERARCQSSDLLTEYRTKTAFGVSHYTWRVEGMRGRNVGRGGRGTGQGWGQGQGREVGAAAEAQG